MKKKLRTANLKQNLPVLIKKSVIQFELGGFFTSALCNCLIV